MTSVGAARPGQVVAGGTLYFIQPCILASLVSVALVTNGAYRCFILYIYLTPALVVKWLSI